MTKRTSNMRYQARLHLRGSTYYFRAKIPIDLIEHYFPKKEIKFSLGTSNKRKAINLVQQESLKLEDKFESIRRNRPNDTTARWRVVRYLDDRLIDDIAARFLYLQLADDEELRRTLQPTDAQWDDLHTKHAGTERHYRKALARGDWVEAKPLLDWFLGHQKIDLKCDEESYKKLAYVFLQSIVKFYEFVRLRNTGEVIDKREAAPGGGLDSPLFARRGGVTLSDLMEDWRKAVVRPEKTVTAVKSEVTQFLSFVDNKFADELQRADFIAYRDYLLQEEKLHYKTVDKKISLLRAVLQKAYDDEKLPANPAARIKIETPSVPEISRLPFDLADLQKIFSSPVYAKRRIPAAGAGEAALWLPLLGLYTGARLEELGQLRVADIKEESGCCHYIHVNDLEDADSNSGTLGARKSVKNASSRRRIPLHRALVASGFLDYVDAQRTAGSITLFPDLRTSVDGKMTGNWSKWWNRYLRDTIGITDRRKVFHSFRHTFINACREAKIREDIHDVLTGHSTGGVSRKYGGNYPLAPLVEAMKKITFKGLEVQKLR